MSALHILPFGLNKGDARNRSLIGRGVVPTPTFIGPFCTVFEPTYHLGVAKTDQIASKLLDFVVLCIEGAIGSAFTVFAMNYQV